MCKFGQITKKLSFESIGEKGIGFKTAFKIASRVQIQSDPFNFYSGYAGRGDNGIGMVTPYHDANFKELPAGIRTRLTLTLNNEESAFEDCVKEFLELPRSLLLFLTKIGRIKIRITEEDIQTITYDSGYDKLFNRASIKESRNGGNHVESSNYIIIRRSSHDMPEVRQRPNKRTAEIVLGCC